MEPNCAGKLMKHGILLFTLIIAHSVYGMETPSLECSSNKQSGSQASHSLLPPKIHEDLMNAFDLMHRHDYDDDEPPAKPLPFLPPMIPPKDQIKRRNRQDTQKLMERAQAMRAEFKSLNTFIDFNCEQGVTILTLAAGHKCRQHIIEFAINHGANPDLANKAGITPLRQAIRSLCPASAFCLILKGATHTHDKTLLPELCSPLSDAIAPKSTRKRVEMLNLFLQTGVDPNTQHLDPKIPFMPCLLSYLLCRFQFAIELAINNPESYLDFLDQRKQMITILLQAGLNPFKKDAQGKTDWQKIVEQKNQYDQNLFNFAHEQIQKKKVN